MLLRLALGALAVAAVAAEVLGGSALARNAIVLAALALIAFAAIARPRPVEDLPFPRRARALAWIPALLAAAVAAPTLALPYFADDDVLLAVGEGAPTPLHAALPSSGDLFMRPTARMVWWTIARLSPHDATLAHAVAVALFAVCAGLVAPALRRCGAPRGVAFASGCLFATSPIALETVAWPSNFFSLLGCGFFLASLATLPAKRAGARAMAAPTAFALLAFLSREDTFLLPVVAAAAGAGFQPRAWRRGIRLAAPLGVALGAVIAARFALLGGLGGYADPAGVQTGLLGRTASGIGAAIASELPVAYALPSRAPIPTALALVPVFLLALGGAAGVARRGVLRGLAIAAAGALPGALLLPIGAQLSGAHLLFVSAVGFALVTASVLAGLDASVLAGLAASARVRWIAVAAFAVLSAWLGARNFDAWRAAGKLVDEGLAAVAAAVEDAPAGARVWVVGLPDSHDGVLCFRNGVPHAVRRAARRPDLAVLTSTTAFGAIDRIVEWNGETRSARTAERPAAAAALTDGKPVRFELARPGADRARCRSFDVGFPGDAGDGWLCTGNGDNAVLWLPVVSVTQGREVQVAADGAGRFPRGAGYALPVAATLFGARGVVGRELVPAGGGRVPEGVDLVRLEVIPLLGTTVTLRSVEIALRP